MYIQIFVYTHHNVERLLLFFFVKFIFKNIGHKDYCKLSAKKETQSKYG